MTTPSWSEPGWLDEASVWVHEQVEPLGRRVTGPLEQLHVRPWSVVLRVPTDTGAVYFKAVGPDSAHEVALTQALAQWRPDCILPVLAADVDHNWMILAEGGATLRSFIRADKDPRRWFSVLPVFAELQLELANRVDDILALGVPDRRLDRLPALYEMLLSATDTLRIGQTPGVTADEYRRLVALMPRFAEMCQELASFGLPATLDHGDFHDANVFFPDGHPVFFDWGDAAVGHPFFSLRTVLVSLENSIGEESAADAFAQLLPSYLEPWTRYAPLADLHKARRLAYLVCVIKIAGNYHRLWQMLDDAGREEYAGPVPSLMQEFLGEVEGTTAYSRIGG